MERPGHPVANLTRLQAVLELNDIRVARGGNEPLVTDLSFKVEGGKLRLVQGPSGCGKSTLLGVISGTSDPGVSWSGKVKLNGVDVTGLPAEKRRIGLMFQDALLFPHMSVGANLAFGLRADVEDRAGRVHAALAEAGLEGFADRDPATLSGGQAARVGLMRTLLAEPDALLMDEAFSALDPELRRSFGGFVQSRIQERGIPALLVSHDAGDAAFADGRVIKLGQRHIVEWRKGQLVEWRKGQLKQVEWRKVN